MISSDRPSQNDSFSGSGLRFANGRTATVVAGSGPSDSAGPGADCATRVSGGGASTTSTGSANL